MSPLVSKDDGLKSTSPVYSKIDDNKNLTSTIGENVWNYIEKKWLDYWDNNKVNISDPDPSKKKFFITVAYPYPNSPQHIGHGRTYTLADVHARYFRLRGYNVLFPMGFHYTGTPILGMSKRVQAGDVDIIENFKKIFGIDQQVIDTFVDPLKIAQYFHNEIKVGMKEMGYSIDWRREFTTIDIIYQKFISWQFKTLKELGVIVQGSHPVGWCPNDGNPVSQHDTLGDVEPSFTEYSLIKFKSKDDEIFFPVATLRPETIFGVTNLWINPNENYIKVLINNAEKWILSKIASKKLEFLNYKVELLSEIPGSEFVGWLVENPLTRSTLPILPASFVTLDDGSGIVMSVPAHAPYDMQALIDIKGSNQVFNGIDLDKITPIPIIDSDFTKESTDGKTNNSKSIVHRDTCQDERIKDYGSIPSLHFLNKYSISDQNDSNLEKATSDLYSLEFYTGTMNENTYYSGMPVSEAKEKVKEQLLKSKESISFFELTNKPVYCRCGSVCYVKMLDNQWFLNYGDPVWKELAFRCLNQMEIIPEEIIGEFKNVFDWLKERACARSSGLGTILPWDRDWIIESLSDSVIYMVYYIIAKYVNTKDLIKYQDLIDDSFFEYILYNKKGKRFDILKEDGTLISEKEFSDNDLIHSFLKLANEIKKEFEYYYPLDSRHSGRDLVPNHLSFFIFNHSILLSEKLWPKQIVVNGSVLMDGKKMSKSMGNIIPLRQTIKQNNADSIRVAMLVLGELLQDVDFSFSALKGIRSKLDEIYHSNLSFYDDNKNTICEFGKNIDPNSLNSLNLEDRWLLNKLNSTIIEITNFFDHLKIRDAINTALYMMDKDFEWYKKRKTSKSGRLIENKKDVYIIYLYLVTRIKILSPFCPFLAEEIWQYFGNSESIFKTSWPEIDDRYDYPVSEINEQYIMDVLSDLNKIVKVTKNPTPNKIFIYLSSKNKNYLYSKILNVIINSRNKNFGEIMKSLMSDQTIKPEFQKYIKDNTDFIKKTTNDILSLSPVQRDQQNRIGQFNEIEPLKDISTMLSTEFKLSPENIFIYSEDQVELYDPNNKARFSRPFKPAIYIE